MPSNENDDKWSYNPKEPEAEAANPRPTKKNSGQPITWTASEFIHHHKNTRWYAAFFGGLFVLTALVFVATRDYISTIVIILAGIIFAVVANRKPNQLPYEITDQGLQIGGKFYEYGNFKSFTVEQEEGVRSINLMPLKRFMPDISVYFPPDQEEPILNLLASHLPHDHQEPKSIDKLARRLRF